MSLTQERLKELLHYDPDTGIFTWKVSRSGTIGVGAGSVAGNIIAKGYVCITVDGRKYKAHRLAWLYVYGEWPPGDLDHENEIKSDNRISNLRPATHSQNKQNQSKPSANNKSGYLGVSPYRKRWRAIIYLDGQQIQIGTFDTPEQASEAYLNTKAILHPYSTSQLD